MATNPVKPELYFKTIQSQYKKNKKKIKFFAKVATLNFKILEK